MPFAVVFTDKCGSECLMVVSLTAVGVSASLECLSVVSLTDVEVITML